MINQFQHAKHTRSALFVKLSLTTVLYDDTGVVTRTVGRNSPSSECALATGLEGVFGVCFTLFILAYPLCIDINGGYTWASYSHLLSVSYSIPYGHFAVMVCLGDGGFIYRRSVMMPLRPMVG